MLVIRPEQMRTLAEDLRLRSLRAFLRTRFPEEWSAAGDRVSSSVENAAARASAYGFREYQDVLRYCILTLLIGDCFEDAPNYSWAREILDDRDSPLAGKRAARLYNTAVRQLREAEESR